MGAFDDGSPFGGLMSLFAGLGGGGGGYDPAAASSAPQGDNFRESWNASQKAMNLPFDDKTFTGWLSAQQQQQQAPEAQTVQLPGFLQGLLGGGNQPVATAPIPGAQQPQSAPDPMRDALKLPWIFRPPGSAPQPGFGGGGPDQAPAAPQQAPQPQSGLSGEDYGGGSDLPAVQQAMQGGAQGGRDYVDTVLDTIAHHESGGRNIHQGIVGANGGYNPSTGTVTGPSSASGPWQMIDSTWRSNAQKVGVDTSKYPTAMSAPVDVQRQVARHIVENNGVGDWAPYNAPLKASLISMGVPLKGGLGGSGGPSPGSTGGGPSSSGGPPGLPGSGPGAPDPDNSANSLNKIELQRIMAGLGPMPATGDPRAGLPVPGAPAPLPGAPAVGAAPAVASASLPGSTATMPGVGANGLGTGAASITPLLQQAQAAPTGPFGGFMPGLFGGNKTAMARAHEAREAQAQQQLMQLNTAKFLNAAGLPLGDALARSGMPIPDAQRQAINQQSAQAAAPVDNSIVPAEYRTLTTQGVPPSIAAEAARKNPTQEALKAADDAINQNKPLPPTVQKMADKQLDMLQATRQSRLTLEQLRDHLYDGSLNLNKFNQYLQKGKAAAGLSDDETVQYQKYVAAIHTLQSDELRKNSGVQTDKDAEREMDKLTGGGITSSEQAITHFNYLINQGNLAEQNLKQRHEQLYTRSKQKMPDNYWEGVETSLPGAPPTADAKTIGSDLYKDHSGKGRPQPMAAPIPGGTDIGLDPARQKQLQSKYGF